jgi:phosphatidate cytidylyltransferase
MLGSRVFTAVVLLAVLAGLLFIDSRWPFLVFLAIVVAITLQEWIRLSAPGLKFIPEGAGVLLGLATLSQASAWMDSTSSYLAAFELAAVVSGLVWIFVMPVQVASAKLDRHKSSLGWSLFAPVCLFATWGVLAQIWLISGAWELLSLLAIVWIADIFAYFGGRKFGKEKLAPAISPGKTREGAAIGLLGVMLWMIGSAFLSGSYASRVLELWGWAGVVITALVLGLLAILGDLFESMLKRQAQVKDSGRLLPGHGGVYDRVDAVVAVLPVAFLIVSDFWYQ